MTPNEIQTICALAGFAALACLIRAAYALLHWSSARHLAHLDAHYRAFAMIAQANRQVRRDAELERAVCALEVQWGVRRG
ncbi:hypothetical protein [Xanthomonas translucens]|uniref:hypothetical protein n=1 Tax=Xanthomonas campestris pv. translucens TaxID=343 RepID=UPI00071E9182|nr:hypothetical protein [Xanthomonas translucens]